ncbi:MAG: hypothetical protein O9324_25025 [Microcystis sp. LE19-84.1B]|uniref:hypothetical protein n=1 Tax=Microcystis sp. LE19-84.1B TaxID=3016438 RepID=UPI0022BB3A45|nr:hypothetical protein [Microcystis sp. LE19-84.1B]MCZ8227110.1 hypothetical protein [Microcystis sp. LE19-84.1B]
MPFFSSDISMFSVISYQLSVISYQLSVISYQLSVTLGVRRPELRVGVLGFWGFRVLGF